LHPHYQFPALGRGAGQYPLADEKRARLNRQQQGLKKGGKKAGKLTKDYSAGREALFVEYSSRQKDLLWPQ